MWESIEKELKRQGINQNQLAKKMGIHNSVITELKKGRIKKPSFELICKVADALGVSLDMLRGEGINDNKNT